MNTTIFQKNIEEHADVVAQMHTLSDVVLEVGKIMAESIRSGRTIFLCGNGGSAADCQHIAAEFIGRFLDDRDPIRAIALTTDTSAITSISNDYKFDDIFARQVSALGQKGDCIIGISTSGNSSNVHNALTLGNELGLRTIGLIGGGGGTIKEIAEHIILIPSTSTARIQEMHILVGHTLVGIVEELLMGCE